MIITRAPLRLSFIGGGTDLPGFYRKYGPGAVISTAINRFVFVSVSEKFDGRVSVRYRHHENVDKTKDLGHALIREILLYYGVRDNIELVISSEVPARGSGLGASSALAVALSLALDRFTGRNFFSDLDFRKRKSLAETAARIEIEKVGSPIGKQDHYASAMGGLNFLRFDKDDDVMVCPLSGGRFEERLEGMSMLFYTDSEHSYFSRMAGKKIAERRFVSKILRKQTAEIDSMKVIYERQRDAAMRFAVLREFDDADGGIEAMRRHINRYWDLKKKLNGEVTNEKIEDIIARAFRRGAVAAKVCGAGGGGFAFLMVPPSMHGPVRAEFSSHYKELHFSFDREGAKIIYDSRRL